MRVQLPRRVPRSDSSALVEHRFEEPGVAGSTPARCTILLYIARMVELADTMDLSPIAQALAGSSPAAGTIYGNFR